MRKLTLVILIAVLLVVAYWMRPQSLEWVRWDGWSQF
jgi:hypothetical protein